tara:strand:+ start:1155 stop:2864 length:1710 start_codon:yes stop_codon:yes gene_type:complete
VDTLRLIKINEKQLYVELSSSSFHFSKKIEVNLKIESIQNLSIRITHDILNNYIKNGPSNKHLIELKELAYELFNILDLFKLEQYFNQIKKDKRNHYLHLVIDSDINFIPFELLNDGKDFLSDYLILSREFTDSNIQEYEFKIDSNEKFSIIGNPSESKDINDDVMREINLISSMVELNFNLRGPFKHRNVDKIELIRLLGSNNLLHFSGHYDNGGWKLFSDNFSDEDILKCSRSSKFIFSNSCGEYSIKFIKFIKAFLNKGTKSIIASFGNLPSDKAAEFSDVFYKFFIHYNHNVGESLFLAKKQIIKKYGYSDLFWAYYQLYGSSLLSIRKKNKIHKYNSNQLKYFIGIICTILFSYFYFTYLHDNSIYQEKIQILVKSNIKSEHQTELIKLDSINVFSNQSYYSLFLKCDSILNSNPYLSLVDINQKKISQLIIDANFKNDILIRNPYKFRSGVLDLYLSNKEDFNRLELFFEDNIEYVVYLRYEKRDSKKIFNLHIIDTINDLSYKINIKELFKIKSPAHKDYLNKYLDKNSSIFFHRKSEFEFIKEDFKFKDHLVIDIKKALIK